MIIAIKASLLFAIEDLRHVYPPKAKLFAVGRRYLSSAVPQGGT